MTRAAHRRRPSRHQYNVEGKHKRVGRPWQTTQRLIQPTPKKVLALVATAILAPVLVGILQARFPAGAIADALRFDDEIQIHVPGDDYRGHSVSSVGTVAGVTKQKAVSPAWEKRITAARVSSGGYSIDLPNLNLVPVAESSQEFDLRSQRTQGIVITGMHVRVLKRGAPLAGAILLPPGQSGGGGFIDANVVLGVPIDDPRQTFTSWSTELHREVPFFRGSHIALPSGETVVVIVTAYASQYYTEWDLGIDYLVGGQPHEIYVNATGMVRGTADTRPFMVTAFAPSLRNYSALYVLDIPRSSGSLAYNDTSHYRRAKTLEEFCMELNLTTSPDRRPQCQ